MGLHFLSAGGFFAFVGIAWLISADRRRISWNTVAWGLGLQLVIGLLIFRLTASRQILIGVNDGVLALLNASKTGSTFLLGPLAAAPGETGSVGMILLFQVLPVAVFFSAFTAALYHLRLLQIVVRFFARIFHRFMKISGAESVCGASNIFVGVESALVIRPYIERMTRSELLAILTTGMSTVASSTLGIYVAYLSGAFPQIAGHLISASLLSIPAAVVMAKVILPETQIPETLATIPSENPEQRTTNLMSAIIEGAMSGLKLVAGISALLIAMLGLVGLMDRILTLPSAWLELSKPLSLVEILSWLTYPLAALLGIAPGDIPQAARLLGERVILTEVVSYQDLAQLIADGQISDPRTVVVLSYALCGFAHVASIAIFVGGISTLAPSRREDLAGLGLRALLAATLATLMTGCVAGIFTTGEGILVSTLR